MDDNFERFNRPSWAHRVNVYVHMNYMRIIDIDTKQQSFQAEVVIESKWHDPTVTCMDEKFDHKEHWIPQLYIDNSLNDVKEDVEYKVVYEKKFRRFMIYEIRKLKGLFWEHLELERFPLDIQSLNITLTTKTPGDIVNLILLDKPVRQLDDQIRNNLDKSLWELQNTVWTIRSTIKREFSYGTFIYPSITITARAFRYAGFFYWNIILPIFLITCASMCPFVIDLKLPQSRIPSTATMLLTTVSMRWIIRGLLPTISYLTVVDKYSLGSLVIIVMLLLYHASMGAFHTHFPHNFPQRLDRAALIVFTALIVIKQFAFIGWVIRRTIHRRHVKKIKMSTIVNQIAAEVAHTANSNEVFL